MAKKRTQPKEFGPAKRLQLAYERGIKQVAKAVLRPKRPEQSYEDWVADTIRHSNSPEIIQASEELARRMVTAANTGNRRTWREAAARATRSSKLRDLLAAEMQGTTGARFQQLVRENAAYIRSVSVEAASMLTYEVTEAQLNGARAGTIAKMVRHRFPELLRNKANLISRTETAKASTALTQARCERLSIDWYQWESSEDQRTRKSHKNMHGVIVPWSQKPSPERLVGEKSVGNYHVGEIFMCRCTAIPILTLDDIQFPARVFWNGKITRMSKQDFRKIAVGLEERTDLVL